MVISLAVPWHALKSAPVAILECVYAQSIVQAHSIVPVSVHYFLFGSGSLPPQLLTCALTDLACSLCHTSQLHDLELYIPQSMSCQGLVSPKLHLWETLYTLQP